MNQPVPRFNAHNHLTLAHIQQALEQRTPFMLESAPEHRDAAVALILRDSALGAEHSPEMLIIQRASHPNDPWSGNLSSPGGKIDPEDSCAYAAAVRETLEETRSAVEIIAPYRMFNLVFVHQIYLMFRAKLLDENFGPTKESTAVQLFHEADIPWEEIAFASIRQTLKDFCHDRQKQAYSFKIKDIAPWNPV